MLEDAPAQDESERNENDVSLAPFSMVASWEPFGSPGLTVINLRQRLLINAREREHWDDHFGDHLNATQTSYGEIRSVVLYIDTYLWAIREKLGNEFPVQPPPHRSKVQ